MGTIGVVFGTLSLFLGMTLASFSCPRLPTDRVNKKLYFSALAVMCLGTVAMSATVLHDIKKGNIHAIS